jgi:hypothetical protein
MQRLVTECGKLLGLARHKNLAADKVGSGPVVPACSKFFAVDASLFHDQPV